MIAICGNRRASDVFVEVSLDALGIEIEIESKYKDLFGELIEKAVRDVLMEMNIGNIKVKLEDDGALDFTIRARVRTAVRRALSIGGQDNV